MQGEITKELALPQRALYQRPYTPPKGKAAVFIFCQASYLGRSIVNPVHPMQDTALPTPLQLIQQAHSLLEHQQFEARKLAAKANIQEQKRLLLADLACHLAQDALENGPLDTASLKNHLYALLTICDAFLPEQKLKDTANALLPQQPADGEALV